VTSGATPEPHGGAVLGIVGAMRAMSRALAALAAIVLATAGPALAGGSSGKEQRDAQDAEAAPVRTAKERLSGKAADEQRVDNCKVPLELRGAKPRPDDCGAGAGRARQR